MKVIVDMDAKTIKDFHEIVIINLGRCSGKTIMDKCFKALSKGKVISEKATNLDVLMTIFPGVTLDQIMCVDNTWAKELYYKEDYESKVEDFFAEARACGDKEDKNE